MPHVIKIVLKTTMILFLTLFWGIPCYAEFLDDWFNQKVYTGPDYYSSSGRSYGTLGSASFRWNNGVDYVAGVTPLKFEKGCGGIDLFMGGFHFMQPEYLVERFGQIMGPAAAAYAFDVALTTMSETFGTSVKSLTSIMDELNQLQYSDCDSQKVVEAVLHKMPLPVKQSQDFSDAVSEHALVSGLSDLFKEIKNIGKDRSVSDTADDLGTDPSNIVSGCSSEIRDLFFTPGLLLDNIVEKLGSPYNTQYAQLLRGLIGDVNINGDLSTQFISQCTDNPAPKNLKIADFLDGNIQKKNSDGDCINLTDLSIGSASFANIRAYLLTTLAGIINNKRNTGVAPSPDEEALLQQTPLADEAINALIVQMGGSVSNEEIAAFMVDYCGTQLIYSMVSDFSSRMTQAMGTATEIFDNTKGSASGSNQNQCQTEIGAATRVYLTNLIDRAQQIQRATYKDYVAQTQVMYGNITNSQSIRQALKDARARISGEINASEQNSGGAGAQ